MAEVTTREGTALERLADALHNLGLHPGLGRVWASPDGAVQVLLCSGADPSVIYTAEYDADADRDERGRLVTKREAAMFERRVPADELLRLAEGPGGLAGFVQRVRARGPKRSKR